MEIFLDLTKTFGTVNYNILLLKVENLVVRRKALNIIKSYLHERKLNTKIGNSYSESKDINCGIRYNFVSFVHNYHRKLYSNREMIYYADDMALMFCGINLGSSKD